MNIKMLLYFTVVFIGFFAFFMYTENVLSYNYNSIIKLVSDSGAGDDQFYGNDWDKMDEDLENSIGDEDSDKDKKDKDNENKKDKDKDNENKKDKDKDDKNKKDKDKSNK